MTSTKRFSGVKVPGLDLNTAGVASSSSSNLGAGSSVGPVTPYGTFSGNVAVARQFLSNTVERPQSRLSR